MGTGSALAEGTAAPATASACTGQAPKVLASGSIWSAPDRLPAARYRYAAAGSPAGPAFRRTYARTRVSQAGMTRSRPLPRLRRRHVFAAKMALYLALSADDLR
jgi:hypothetical protein